MNPMEKDLQNYYRQFDLDHDRLRDEFVQELAEIDRPAARRLLMPRVARGIVAVAAAMLIVLGATVTIDLGNGPELLSGQAAWAEAMNQVPQVSSIHFTISTPSGNESPAAEVWWRSPDQFRMELPGGQIIASNGQARFHYVPADKRLMISEPGPGPEMFILGELGGLFAEQDLARDWARTSTFLSSEPVEHKGTQSRKVLVEKDGHVYEYIIDARAESVRGEGRMPFYEVREYSGRENGRLLSHLEVIEVGIEWPTSLFTIEPPAGTTIVDRRME